MPKMEIDPRPLRYFLAVAEELNFNRAAERVHLSQPSLSVAIRKLEAHCGFKLFERNVRGVELTDHGRRLMPVARNLIERSETVGAFVPQLARGEPEVFRVGYSPLLDMRAIGSCYLGVSSARGGHPRANSALCAIIDFFLLSGTGPGGLKLPFSDSVRRHFAFFPRLPFCF